MGKTWCMMRKKKYDDDASYNTQPIKPWSDLTHDVLLLVMMKLGVVDFLAFRRVCKSWRSLTVSNSNKFMVSKPPMSMCFSTHANTCWLKDFEGRKFKTTLPHSANRTCVGSTCGYVILLGMKTRDFWLVNPITRHELHFPRIPFDKVDYYGWFRGILVNSPVSGWVFVISDRFVRKIWFSVSGKREWTRVPTPFHFNDLHAFKGKIYALHHDYYNISEVCLFPTPKVTLLEIKSFPKGPICTAKILSLGENLYLWDFRSRHFTKIHEIDIGEPKCVSRENIITVEECAFFCSNLKYGVSGYDLWSNYHKLWKIDRIRGKWKISYGEMWYFFHDCLNVNTLNE